MNKRIIKPKDAFKETLEFFKGDLLAANVWLEKQALRTKEGELLESSPKFMFHRLTKELTPIDELYENPYSYDEIKESLVTKEFLFGGSNLYGIGNMKSYTSLANCFVIGNTDDSYSGILQTDSEQALLMKRRGGVGHDISHLRPEGFIVQNAARTSTGACSFMDRFSNTTREVGQDGRRGALMLTMLVTHPDIEKFIIAKDDPTKITGANISVKITDEFMQAVLFDKHFVLRYPHVDNLPSSIKIDTLPLDQLVERDGLHLKKVKATKIWDLIAMQAHKNGEPGLLFWDHIKKESPADCYERFQTIGTNPCGEVPLSPYDSCRLASLIVHTFVKYPYDNLAHIDYPRLKKAIWKLVKLMDDIIDIESYHIENILKKINSDVHVNNIEYNLWKNIQETLLSGRRLGIGIVGLADMFAKLNINYSSQKAVDVAEELARFIAIESTQASIQLAKDRGHFPVWDLKKEEDNPFLKRVISSLDTSYKDMYKKYGRRNIGLLAIAPTGTLSILSQCSNGIEPVYELMYQRKRKVDYTHPNISYKDDNGDYWEEYNVIHQPYQEWYDFFKDLLPNNEDLENAIPYSPYFKQTSTEVDSYIKIKIQAAIQKWVDHSISVTHNLPKEATVQDVQSLYFQAFNHDCKGVTIYRQGSRLGVLTTKKKKTNGFKQNDSIKRPKDVKCEIHTTISSGKKYTVCIGIVDNHPFEVFAFDGTVSTKLDKTGILRKIKKGHYDLLDWQMSPIIENITNNMSQSEEDRTRMISTALRHGADIKHVVTQLRKSKGDITVFSKAIARVLSKFVSSEIQEEGCPKCSQPLIREAGCIVCKSCGYSKCE